MTTTIDRYRVGAFTMEARAPGLSHMVWTGKADAESFAAMRAFGIRCRESFPPGTCIKGLVDVRGATGIARGAHKQLHLLGRDKSWDRVAFVGARFEIKVALELAVRSFSMLKLDLADTTFVDTPDEALAWLERPGEG